MSKIETQTIKYLWNLFNIKVIYRRILTIISVCNTEQAFDDLRDLFATKWILVLNFCLEALDWMHMIK